MKVLILQYWLEFVFGIGVAGLGVMYKFLMKKVCDQKCLKNGTQALLRNQIINAYDKYIHQEWIPIYGRENVLEMYDAYHSLGGNGAITSLMKELEMLSSNPPGK